MPDGAAPKKIQNQNLRVRKYKRKGILNFFTLASFDSVSTIFRFFFRFFDAVEQCFHRGFQLLGVLCVEANKHRQM